KEMFLTYQGLDKPSANSKINELFSIKQRFEFYLYPL
ncbi:MAG: hypothetical protein ACI837_002835, partial [Crocinitomicaceae bacterium]